MKKEKIKLLYDLSKTLLHIFLPLFFIAIITQEFLLVEKGVSILTIPGWKTMFLLRTILFASFLGTISGIILFILSWTSLWRNS